MMYVTQYTVSCGLPLSKIFKERYMVFQIFILPELSFLNGYSSLALLFTERLEAVLYPSRLSVLERAIKRSNVATNSA